MDRTFDSETMKNKNVLDVLESLDPIRVETPKITEIIEQEPKEPEEDATIDDKLEEDATTDDTLEKPSKTDDVNHQKSLIGEEISKYLYRYLEVSQAVSLASTCKKMLEFAKKKEIGKITLIEDGYKYLINESSLIKVTESGCFIEIRVEDLEFMFQKPIRCDNIIIYSEVWITEHRNDLERRKEHLWRFPNVPRETLRNSQDQKLHNMLYRAQYHIGKRYPWFVKSKPSSLNAMMELYLKINDLIKPIKMEQES